jgi:hypothetical protein
MSRQVSSLSPDDMKRDLKDIWHLDHLSQGKEEWTPVKITNLSVPLVMGNFSTISTNKLCGTRTRRFITAFTRAHRSLS